MIRFFKQLYLNNRFFQAVAVIVVLFILAFFFPFLVPIPKVLFFILSALAVIDAARLSRVKKGIEGRRITPDKLSNGDQNMIQVDVHNVYPFRVELKIIDEIPPVPTAQPILQPPTAEHKKGVSNVRFKAGQKRRVFLRSTQYFCENRIGLGIPAL